MMTRALLVSAICAGAMFMSAVSRAQTTQTGGPTAAKLLTGPAQGGGTNQVIPASPADRPAARNDDATWLSKHTELVEKAKKGHIDLYFEGDSITRRWEATHKANWEQNFGGWRAGDSGAGGAC